MVYHSLLGSNPLYNTQLWWQTNLANQNSIQVLQNYAIRKICFKKKKKKKGILKFCNLIKLQTWLFLCQLEQDEQLAKTFPALKHNYQTRSTIRQP